MSKSENQKERDLVVFQDLERGYLPGKDLSVFFVRSAELKANSRDWIGIFKVGWTSSRDYYTFEWAPLEGAEEAEGKVAVVFAGRRLPPVDSHFYQFCYVSRDGVVRGASAPFQIISEDASKPLALDDLEVVEIGSMEEDGISSMVMLQPKRQKEVEAIQMAQKELALVKQSLRELEEEKERETSSASKRQEELMCELQEKSSLIKSLQQEVERLLQQQASLQEQLEREKTDRKSLMASHLEGESEQQNLREVIKLQEEALEATRMERMQAEEEKQMAHFMAKEKEQEVTEISNMLQQSQEEAKEQGLEVARLVAALQEEKKEVNRLKQELSVTEQNVVELLCAAKQYSENPPTASQPTTSRVDIGAYEALQLAYENMEKYYHAVRGERDEAQGKLMEKIKVIEELEDTKDELLSRVGACKEEFAAKARECAQLQKQLQEKGSVEDAVTLQELLDQQHAQQQDMAENYRLGVEELALRSDECVTLRGEVKELQEQFSKLQLQSDQKLASKNAALDELRSQMDTLQQDKAALENKAAELEAQLKSGGVNKEIVRECPVCKTKFPARMKQKDFESHVNRHFK